MNLISVLDEQSSQRPQQAALVVGQPGREVSISYAQLAKESAQRATFLTEQGIRQGDRVLVFEPMGVELYRVLLALFRIGAVAVFIDPSAGRELVRRSCQLARPRAFIGSAKAQLYRLWLKDIRQIPIRCTTRGWWPGTLRIQQSQTCAPLETIAPGEDAPALLTFTSGSTGLPKAALRSHAFLLDQHRALAEALELQAGQKDLTTLPIFLLANLASGLTSVIPNADLRRPANIKADKVIAQARYWQVERSAGSPAFYAALARQAEEDQKSWPFQRLDLGGAPVFPPLLERLAALAPEQKLVAVYGSTEAEPMAHSAWNEVQPQDHDAMRQGAGLLVGQPVESLSLRILQMLPKPTVSKCSLAELEALTLTQGKVGEILVRGRHVLPAYWWAGEGPAPGDEETKIQVDDKVWHRTGDAGYLDAKGRLWLLGRCQACVKDAHGDLYPFAVECAASSFPGVLRSAMLLHQGRRYLLVEGEVNVPALLKSLSWARLDKIQKVEQIPVDARHNAKVDYTKLKNIIEDV